MARNPVWDAWTWVYLEAPVERDLDIPFRPGNRLGHGLVDARSAAHHRVRNLQGHMGWTRRVVKSLGYSREVIERALQQLVRFEVLVMERLAVCRSIAWL